MTVTDFGAFVPGPRMQLEPTGSGPLDGLTFVTKDLIDIAGSVTGGGNPDWHGHQTPAATSAGGLAALPTPLIRPPPNEKTRRRGRVFRLADREGFEPPNEFPRYALSKRAH